ncbi:MAG TPA: malectin domain-containing carbohydrate-binding protein [Opitutaceae bacterium]|nr:malectin domain-containing carbohydrate-binding protein [Opitutaceae bacterium]
MRLDVWANRALCWFRALSCFVALGWFFPSAMTAAVNGSVSGDSPRTDVLLASGWRSVAVDTSEPKRYDGAEKPGFDDDAWSRVEVPHNWDDYGGAHRLVHGNRHGTAWYRRKFEVAAAERGRRVFLFFEGVGSYATVWVNGKLAGRHAGGRTTFTLDVTDLVNFGGGNALAVRADHPAGITDLPWVCGGCSTKPGFSEGGQPMGIFRPVHLVTTNDVRVVPFGIHVWNDANATAAAATIHVTTELKNYGATRALTLETRVLDGSGTGVARASTARQLGSGETTFTESFSLEHVALWSLTSPTLYTLETLVRDGDRVLDRVKTKFGIRTIHWPDPNAPESSPFLLNGKPVFINGTCEYEHVLGASHAFGDEQIRARVAQIRAAGFNGFRDAHQPHNIRYQECWDRDGLLWWPQFAAQIWFDTPEFRANFKALLRDWVRERRNSPSLVLWGLANESKLPPDFARECVEIIRELDPTSPSQRLVTTCNSGKGTDWNVPQNWSGTYGGKPEEYASDLKRQRLVGEYGAWRSLGLHSEGGFIPKGVRSEDRAAALLEMKIRLAESVRAEVPGHFHWLFATHENPGRTIGSEGQQGADGWAELDRIGPANNKGLLTLWGEPTDLFYLYRSNYATAATDPMVYIVSHTWPDRWTGPGRKSGIIVYSNCDEVELFNDVGARSLGTRKRGPIGTHFQWDDVEISTNVLYAEGRLNGRVVARDAIVLKNLPEAPHRRGLNGTQQNLTAAAPGQNYLYRVNCGGPDYVDVNGQRWFADHDFAANDTWGSVSWAAEYSNVPPRFGSQRATADPIAGTTDEALFQTYRYGREKLRYRFAVPDGEHRIELYFTEPWYGAGGGDCIGWRLFDVAVNGETKLHDLDLYKESGYAHALKKVVNARASNGWLEISFPHVASYQAVISAIAISTSDANAKIPLVTRSAAQMNPSRAMQHHSEEKPLADAPAASIQNSYSAKQARIIEGALEGNSVVLKSARDRPASISWNIQAGLGGVHDMQLRYVSAHVPLLVELKVHSSDGTLIDAKRWTLPATNGASSTSQPDGGLSFNAGEYTATFTLLTADSAGLRVEFLTVR